MKRLQKTRLGEEATGLDFEDRSNLRFRSALDQLTNKNNHVTPTWHDNRQCLHCDAYLEFLYPVGADYGVCLRPESEANGQVVFEHFGCKHHRYVKG